MLAAKKKRILTGIRPSMYTDPTRLRATDPGHVEGNPAFLYHEVFNLNREEVADLKGRYRRGAVGDVGGKQKLATALNTFLEPIRERRAALAAKRGEGREALGHGTDAGRQAPQPPVA